LTIRDVQLGEQVHAVALVRLGSGGQLVVDGRRHDCQLVGKSGNRLVVSIDGRDVEATVHAQGRRLFVHAFGRAWDLEVLDPSERAARAAAGGDETSLAPMPGLVVAVLVGEGEAVRKGQLLLVIESMKMQTEILARRDGVVERVLVQSGQTFERGAPLVKLSKD